MESKRQNKEIVHVMRPLKLFTWPIGIWPLQVYNVGSLIRFLFAIFCLISVIVILPFMELQTGCTNADQNIDCLMFIANGINATAKIIWFRVYSANLMSNYNLAVNDYLTIENVKERVIMQRYSFIGRTLSCIMVLSAYFCCFILFLIPLLEGKGSKSINATDKNVLEFPIPSRCTLEYINFSTSMYRIFCFAQFVIVLIAATCNYGSDALFYNIVLHVCGQLKILKKNFVNLDVANPKVQERFSTLIRRHSYLIEMGRKLADMISFVILIQLFISSILICIIGFQFILALKFHNIAIMVKSFMIFSAFLAQITVYSVIGDHFKSQIEEVGFSVYQFAWYVLPKNIARNLIFIIMQTQSSVKLQAGNFIVINLTTYMSILKTSMSYLSVLRVMVEKEGIIKSIK